MASSFEQYLGDGATRLFSVPFDYLSKAHVTVTVDGAAVTPAWEGDQAVRLPVAPAADAVVEVVRQTPGATRLVDFVDGSVLTERDLDLSALQLLFIAQEAADKAARAIGLTPSGRFDARGLEIVNVGAPSGSSSAVSRGWAEKAIQDSADTVAGKTVFVFVEKDPNTSDEEKRYFIHRQTEPATEWTVEHGLKSYPKPTVFDASGAFVLAEYEFDGLDKLIITLAEPTSGIAYVS